MDLPNQYITSDNSLSLSIATVRNDGKLSYSLSLFTDINKYIDGGNLIESLLLENPTDLFTDSSLSLHTGSRIYDYGTGGGYEKDNP